MKKTKLYSIIFVLIGIVFFGTAALCNQCGIIASAGTTASTTAESNTSETVAETETTVAEETTTETAPKTTMDTIVVDSSKLAPVFAIANESGDKLISFYSAEGATGFENLNGAIGDNGQFYSIEYVKKQNRSDQDSGRVVSANFDNMEGYVYSVPGNKLAANNTYYLCNSDVINKGNLLTTVSTGIVVLDKETKTQIENIKVRGLQEAWIIDEYSDGTQVLIALFESNGNNLLMSIALKTADGIKFKDYPVVSDGQSAWRVDDGGKIDPKLFSILFAARAKEGLLFVVRWAGAEGENTFFLLEKADALNQLPWEIYRYWSAG
ncbi:MAG: hypothetical protein ACYCXB_03460 [Candidatus Humimicrobiaceae bacterium]